MSNKGISMKHIVIFRTSASYLDINTYNCQELGLAKALVRKDYKVSLLMGGPREQQISVDCGNENHADVYYLTYHAIHQSLCVFMGWKELLLQLHPDVLQIHDMGNFMTYLASKWAKKHSIRCVLIQGTYHPTQKPLFKQLELLFNNTLGKAVLRNVESIGCKTKAAAKYIAQYSNKVTSLTPVGLDVDKLKAEESTDHFRQEHDLGGKKVLLYVGKMEPRRNPLFLLQLMRSMPQEYVLVLVGDGPLMGSIRKEVNGKRMTNVLVLGKKNQEELPSIYNSSDLFLLASNYEIFGMVILESMYFGLPVVSSSTAGSETIIGTDNGVVLAHMDVELWKKAIIDLCSAPDRLSKMKVRCKEKILGSYVWSKACEKFESLY